jgi:MFS transporter, putative metabolite:H+ symporter
MSNAENRILVFLGDMEATKVFNRNSGLLVIVAALGYFVDIYDLILFSIVRTDSLLGIGVSQADIESVGLKLINAQMIGMLTGGLLWGILGDKKGRLSVLFGSIILYSVANIANGFVTTVEMYSVMRFIAGIGLAGELGAGITLISETMTKENRGYGTMVVVGFGVLGAVLAAMVGKMFTWQIAYFIGGGLGLALLILRIGVYESGMFSAIKEQNVSRGNFFKLFSTFPRFLKYLSCITIGIPIWYLIGVLVTFSPEFSRELNIPDVKAGTAVMWFYIGTSFGDFMSGYLSQVFKNRKKVVFSYLLITLVSIPIYLFTREISTFAFYCICILLGIAGGYWAVFVTIASEQFGTNLRSTVTTTVPNFVRGSLVLLTVSFKGLQTSFGMTKIHSALLVGVVAVVIAFISLYGLEESYGKDLDYVEID